MAEKEDFYFKIIGLWDCLSKDDRDLIIDFVFALAGLSKPEKGPEQQEDHHH